jgi:hypothetical protein
MFRIVVDLYRIMPSIIHGIQAPYKRETFHADNPIQLWDILHLLSISNPEFTYVNIQIEKVG